MTAAAAEAPRTAGLEQALDLSRQLQARVESRDWEAAAALEAARRTLLEGFFARPPPPAELHETVRLLKELVAANEALVGIAEHIQRGLAREAETVAVGRRAVLAYSSHAV